MNSQNQPMRMQMRKKATACFVPFTTTACQTQMASMESMAMATNAMARGASCLAQAMRWTMVAAKT